MADGTRVFEPAPGRGPAIDTREVDLGPDGIVRRQRVSLAGTADDTDVPVLGGPAAADEQGLVIRQVAPLGRTHYGQSLSLAPSSTGNVTELIAETTMLLRGFAATGDGDGLFHLTVDDEVQTIGRIHNIERSVERLLPFGIAVPQGAVVAVTVRCDSQKASCSYEASLYLEDIGG